MSADECSSLASSYIPHKQLITVVIFRLIYIYIAKMTSKEDAIASNSELNTKNWLNSLDSQNGQDLESLDGSSIVESSICSSESESGK